MALVLAFTGKIGGGKTALTTALAHEVEQPGDTTERILYKDPPEHRFLRMLWAFVRHHNSARTSLEYWRI
jgi:deoxyadenosine/deoxycytidine kinase